jgi:hypothetical protein
VNAPICPECGGRDFRLYVTQRIHVTFDEDDGKASVYQGPEGELDWDENTEAFCNNDECGFYGPLAGMKEKQA